VRCQRCGHDNPPEARFCANCGFSLAPAVEPPSPVPAAKPAVAFHYMGFWIRLAAAVIDYLVISVSSSLFSLTLNVLALPSQVGVFLLFPVFWLYHWLFIGLKGQTLGKMAFGIKVVNDDSGSVPGLGRAALREIPGKILSTIALHLGFLWVIWDKRKQGWHDKIAGTCVLKVKSGW
jgi:uncharacterized RDD family membrane protein YckC